MNYFNFWHRIHTQQNQAMWDAVKNKRAFTKIIFIGVTLYTIHDNGSYRNLK